MRATLRRSIIVPGRANNEHRGGPGGPGTGFCGPGDGLLNLSSNTGLSILVFRSLFLNQIALSGRKLPPMASLRDQIHVFQADK